MSKEDFMAGFHFARNYARDDWDDERCWREYQKGTPQMLPKLTVNSFSRAIRLWYWSLPNSRGGRGNTSKYSFRSLSRKLGMSSSGAIQNIIGGRSTCSLKTVHKLARMMELNEKETLLFILLWQLSRSKIKPAVQDEIIKVFRAGLEQTSRVGKRKRNTNGRKS